MSIRTLDIQPLETKSICKETMRMTMLDIQPGEIKLIFEVKKQSSSAVQLSNNSEYYVAFKVKTTSPKKYCVRPNTGIIKPNSKCDFTVLMLAQQSTPPDLQCRDKFLIQSTVVPFGSTEDDISPDIFSKDNGKNIEEKKLKVRLVSPPHSSPVLLPLNGVTKQELPSETLVQNEKLQRGIENYPPFTFFKTAEEIKVKTLDTKVIEDVKLSPVKDVNLGNDIEELKSKLASMESKLSEVGFTIEKLNEERSRNIQEKEKLRQELTMLRRTNGAKVVHVGFPFLYVCMVALISLTFGYILHS